MLPRSDFDSWQLWDRPSAHCTFIYAYILSPRHQRCSLTWHRDSTGWYITRMRELTWKIT